MPRRVKCHLRLWRSSTASRLYVNREHKAHGDQRAQTLGYIEAARTMVEPADPDARRGPVYATSVNVYAPAAVVAAIDAAVRCDDPGIRGESRWDAWYAIARGRGDYDDTRHRVWVQRITVKVPNTQAPGRVAPRRHDGARDHSHRPR